MGLSLGFYGLNKNFDIEKKELVKSEKTEEKNDLSYLSLNDLSSISKDFKFHDNSFIYKNKIFQEGDILGNMRIEKINWKGPAGRRSEPPDQPQPAEEPRSPIRRRWAAACACCWRSHIPTV